MYSSWCGLPPLRNKTVVGEHNNNNNNMIVVQESV